MVHTNDTLVSHHVMLYTTRCNSVHYQCKRQNSNMADHNNNSIFLIRIKFCINVTFLHYRCVLKEITMDNNRSPWSLKDKLVFQTQWAPDNSNNDVEEQ